MKLEPWRISIIVFVLLTALSASLTMPPVNTESSEKKVFIYSPFISKYKILVGLVEAEGFDVTATSILPVDPVLLSGTNVFIHFADISGDYDESARAHAKFLPFVEAGAGYLIIPSEIAPNENYGTMISSFGVIPLDTDIRNSDVTDRLTVHDVMEDVHSIWIPGFHSEPLSLISSDPYPLVIGNDIKWGIKDPVFMVAANYSQGRVIVSGFGRFEDEGEEYYSGHDNALLFKNIVYWLAGEVVPEHSHDMPTLISLEDKIAQLNATFYELMDEKNLLQSQLDEFGDNLENLPEFMELRNQISQLQQENSDLDQQLTQLQQENSDVSQRISQLQQGTTLSIIAYVAIGLAAVATVISLVRTRRVKAP